MKNIVLVGFMATGKTSVGKILAKKLSCPVIDVDHCIEEKEKRKISDIFAKDGEPFFRKLEKDTIREIAQGQGVIITTGGGAVMDPENMEALRKTGWIVALFAKPETIFQRARSSHHRPLLKVEDMLAEINRLLTIRKPFYEKSDFQFDTDGRSAGQVAQLILETLEGKL